MTEAGAMLIVKNLKGLNFLDLSNCSDYVGFNNLPRTIEKRVREALPRATLKLEPWNR